MFNNDNFLQTLLLVYLIDDDLNSSCFHLLKFLSSLEYKKISKSQRFINSRHEIRNNIIYKHVFKNATKFFLGIYTSLFTGVAPQRLGPVAF